MSSLNKRKDRKSSDGRRSSKAHRTSKREESVTNERKESDIIVLKVRGDSVSVKKEILIASSEYFKAKFAGHFGDSDAKELDLTKDVEEIEDLEMLLGFLRNNEVKITVDNVCRILKVSSFFLVDSLTDYCAAFMSETACLANCIQYYIAAVNFALPERFSRKFESFVRGRFHDLIIFENFVAEYINDEEFKLLCSSEVLKYCSKESLFNFLLKWLSKSPELTINQYKVASDVIQYFEQCKSTQAIPFQCDKKKAIANINRMTDTIRKSRDQDLLQNFQQLFTDFLRNKEPVFLHTDLHSPDTCIGIFTVSKRVSVNRAEDRNSPKCSFYLPSQSSYELFDVCVYEPGSRVWFHIASFREDEYFRQVDGCPYKTISQLRKKFPVNIFCDIEATGNEILLRDVSNRFKLLRLDFERKKWTNFCLNDIAGLEAHQFVSCKNGLTYCITSNCIQATSIYPMGLRSYTEFRGYTFDFKRFDISTCNPVFSTTRFYVDRGPAQTWCKMKVKYSSISNELLILSSKGTGSDIAAVVDLDPLEKGGKPTSHSLLHREVREYKNDSELLFVDVDILEIEDKFLVLSSANNLLTVKFQYTFRSKVLTKVDDGWQYALSNVCDFQREKWNCLIFGDSCWHIIEEYEHANKVRKVRFNNSGAADDEDHTPPPFVKPVTACVTEVRKSLFYDLEPVRNFLEFPEKRHI